MKDKSVMSRRERKKQNCKYSILKAAKELMTEQGMDVLIEDIANKADISYPTFYNYFPTKASLYYALYLEEIEDLQEYIELEIDDNVSEVCRIQSIFDTLMSDFKRYPYIELCIAGEVARKTAEDNGKEEITQLFMTAIEKGMEKGEFRGDVNPRNYALLIAGINLASAFHNCSDDESRAMLQILINDMSRK